jgi:hypothetical protein
LKETSSLSEKVLAIDQTLHLSDKYSCSLSFTPVIVNSWKFPISVQVKASSAVLTSPILLQFGTVKAGEYVAISTIHACHGRTKTVGLIKLLIYFYKI